MKVLYTSTLCVSSEKSPTCGQILPILEKLKDHFTAQEGDSLFVSGIKQKVWTDLSGGYQVYHSKLYLMHFHGMVGHIIHTKIILFWLFCFNLVFLSVLCFKLKEDNIQEFLEEVTAMDPRFKAKSDRDSTWDRLQEAAIAANATETEEVLYSLCFAWAQFPLLRYFKAKFPL